MFKGKKLFGVIAVVAMSVSSQAFSQDKGCFVLKSVAEVEKVVQRDLLGPRLPLPAAHTGTSNSARSR